MAKATPLQWEKAKTLFELGKSLTEIQNETGIDRSNVNKRAKSEGWRKGFLPQIIDAKVKNLEDNHTIEEIITTLKPQQQRTVVTEVERILQSKDWYATAARKVATKALDSLMGEYTARDAKDAMSTLLDGMKAEQIVPFYPSQANVKVEVNNEKLDPLLSNAIRDAAKIIES